jgi:putative membrane protein
MKYLLILAAGFMGAIASAFADTHDSYKLQLDDGQIADVVLTASSISIEAAQLAKLKSPTESVRQYAEKMIGEHGSVNDSMSRLVKKINVAPVSNPISKSMKADGEADLERLRSLSGEAFDRAYIRQEIVLYQDVLDTVDNRLMPNATSEELKTVLYNLFAPLSLHLEQAQQIQEALNEDPAGKRREGVHLQLTGEAA